MGDNIEQKNMGLVLKAKKELAIYSNNLVSRGLNLVKQLSLNSVNGLYKAAEQGEAVAQNNLGVVYSNGEGVPVDYVEAIKWYRKSVEKGMDIDKVLSTLTPREDKVIRMRLGIGEKRYYTIEEIAELFGVTPRRIMNIATKALKKLKHPSRLFVKMQ